MKILYILLFMLIIFMGCNQEQAKPVLKIEKNEEHNTVNYTAYLENHFDSVVIGQLPIGWSQATTGNGETTEWKVIDDNGNRVFAQLSSNNPNYHFNIAIYDDFEIKDIGLKVKLKAVAGKMDQGGGLVWRYKDSNNYYVVRANPLENNVVLYKVIDGKRTDLPVLGKGKTYGVDVPKLGNDWIVLSINIEGDLFTVSLNYEELFQVKDQSIRGAGKFGLWTKADAVTYFDDLRLRDDFRNLNAN